MLVLTAKKEDLKKAFGIASSAVMDQADKVNSHSLIKVSGNKAIVYSTDGDKMAFSGLDVISEGSYEFTFDPKKMSSIVSGSDVDDINISLNQETKSVEVVMGEAVLSFSCFSTEEFLTFEKEIEVSVPLGSINTDSFQFGLRFIQGLLPEEKNPKSDKYTKLYAIKGVLYGANGINKIGAFQSQELSSLDELSIRRGMIGPLTNTLDKMGIPKISVSTTSRAIFITSEDKTCGFGFLRSSDPMVKYPISIDTPTSVGININKSEFLKKLGRLAQASNDEVLGIKASLDGIKLSLKTVTERVSKDVIECKRLSSEDTQPIEFIFEYKLFKSLLNSFMASNIDMYIDSSKCTFVSAGDIEVLDTVTKACTKSPFKSVALMSLSRAV